MGPTTTEDRTIFPPTRQAATCRVVTYSLVCLNSLDA
jgi:hypothetical protein